MEAYGLDQPGCSEVQLKGESPCSWALYAKFNIFAGPVAALMQGKKYSTV